MKVLLAVDGSSYSDAAIDDASSRAWPANTQIRVVNAVELPIVATPEVWVVQPEYYEQTEKIARQHAEEIVNRAEAKLTDRLNAEIVVTKEIVLGSPKLAIVELADKWNADLILVGSHGYGPWHRFLLGSVSQAIVSHAKCSVEVVRSPRHPEQVKAA